MYLPFSVGVGPAIISPNRFLLIAISPSIFLRGSDGEKKRDPVIYLLLAHCIWSAVALLINDGAKSLESSLIYLVEVVIAYMAGRYAIRSPEDFRNLVGVATALLIVSLPLAMVESLTGRMVASEILARTPGIIPVQNVITDIRMGLHRAQVVFSHPIHYGVFSSICFSLILVGLAWTRSLPSRMILASAALLASILSLSSGAILAVAIQIGLMVWWIVFFKFNRRWYILIALIAAAIVIVEIISSRGAIRVFMSYATFSAHNAYWRAEIFNWGIYNVGQNPLFGLGFKDWERPSWMHSASVDNFWLLAAMRYGLPGFGFLVLAFLFSFKSLVSARVGNDTRTDYIRHAMIFSLIGMAFLLSTVHIWGPISSFFFFLLGAGRWIATIDSAERKDKANFSVSRGMVLTRFPDRHRIHNNRRLTSNGKVS